MGKLQCAHTLNFRPSEHPALNEISKNKDAKLKIECSGSGAIAFEQTDWGSEPYMKKLKNKIELNICPPREFT